MFTMILSAVSIGLSLWVIVNVKRRERKAAEEWRKKWGLDK